MAYITRTTGTATDRKKFTYSAWLKLANIEVYQRPIQNYLDSNNRGYILYHHNTDANPNTWFFYDRISSQINFQATSVAKYRDTNGFYHLVVRADTTQSTQADRYRVYINNEQIDLNISVNIGQNVDLGFNSSSANLRIGGTESGSEPWKGIMSHVHFCDGQSYAPTEFGEYDANGVWKIKTSPSVTYGNNGYWVFKDDASVTDRSGNGNNFTLSGSITKTEDCPSNVFPTINPLTYSTTKWNLEYGNLRTNGLASGESAAWRSVYGTLGASSGKYYFEMKVTRTYSVDSNNIIIGIVDAEQMKYEGDNGKFFGTSRGYGYHAKDGKKLNNDSVTANGVNYGNSWTTNDIIGCAFDLDNHKLYFSKNGSWQNSGDPTSGATGTGSAFDLATGYTYLPTVSHFYDDDRIEFNFGNGYFGTTAVASAGTNASGNGIFEFDCPNGYTALSTKGLNL